MFKLVVLSTFVAIAVAKPSGLLIGSPVVQTYSAPVVAVPAAVSSTYRKDVISKPAIVAYSAPAVVETPLVHNVAVAPVLQKVVAPVQISAAATHSYRSDFISEPVVLGHAAPAVVAHSAPVVVAHSGPALVAHAAPIQYAAASVHAW